MTGLALRPMNWWDIPDVATIEADSFPTTAWSVETLWSELAGVPDTRWYIVATGGERVVGYAGLMTSGPHGDVQTIAVKHSLRGRGVGGRLLDALLDEATRRACSQVMLEVAADNVRAQSLYAGRGFHQLARRSDYYGVGHDALVMRRRLTGDSDG